MPTEVFQLTTVTRVLAEDVELTEALGFSEISALDDAERKWRACLQVKAKTILEDASLAPTISIHRRKIVAEVVVDSVELTFEPPRRSPNWQEALQLCVHFVRWAEEDLHHAFVPVSGVHVFAPRAALLPERVREHVRLLLASRTKEMTLYLLGESARVKSLRVSQMEVSVNRKTPKQFAMSSEETGEKSSILEKVAEELPSNLPQAAFEMELELKQLAETLAGPHRRSVLLIGPPGCGKTALVRELARRRGEFQFGNTAFWSTSGPRLMIGPIGFGMWQERCQQMCREVSKINAILHLNNLGELLEVGKATRGEQSVGGFLRPWIARGQVLAIAECTPEQFGVIERQEPHLAGAFQQLNLVERTPEETRAILQFFNAAQGKELPNPAATKAALDRLHQLHLRYATYSANPGRPLRFLKNLLADTFPEKAITEAQVIAGFSRETGLPPALLDDEIPLELERTLEWFEQRVIGQPEAGSHVVDLLALIKTRLTRPRKPLASFLFIGPTGTGKTEMAKAIAEFLFGDAARLVRFDLNEFSDAISVQRLIGGPATGEAEGLLTARLREQPFSVVLLDEFEKADPSFFDLLLQILGDGRLSDAAGRVADFCNSVIVMTSNLGAQGFQRGPSGFRADGMAVSEAQDHFTDAVRKFLRPEIFNRLDAIVPFRALSPDIVLAIARRHLDLVRQRDGLRLRPIDCQVQPEVASHLAASGYDPRYGARPLKRAIERELLVPLAEALNQYQKETPLTAEIGMVKGRVCFHLRALKNETVTSRDETPDRLARRIVAMRRRVSRLQHCMAIRKIEDETTMLESLERRVAASKWKSPPIQNRLMVLPKLRACLRAVAALGESARQLEMEALGLFYQRKPPESAFDPKLETIDQERSKLSREVFRLQLDQPDDVVLAFFSEHRETLFEFAAAYQGLIGKTGQRVALDYFLPPPGGRSKATKIVRETPKKPDSFFVTPPEKVIGIVMHLRGDLFYPRFSPESGLQVVKEKKIERVCLIQTAMLPFVDYEPPAGIDRQGAIKALGASVCRTFDRENNLVRDNVLGERPWVSLGAGPCLEVLIEERLNRAIEKATSQAEPA